MQILADGKPVFGPFFKMATGQLLPPEMWQTASDGGLLVLGEVDNAMKRISITPSPDTSIATLMAGGAAPRR